AVAAGRAVDHRRVHASHRGDTAVLRARVVVPAVPRVAGAASGDAALVHRAGIVVEAITVRDAAALDGGVGTSAARVAGVDRARVAVVAERRRPLDAGAGLAGLQTVAGIEVATGLAVGHRGEGAPARGVAAIGGARVAVVTRPRIAHAGVRHAAFVDRTG